MKIQKTCLNARVIGSEDSSLKVLSSTGTEISLMDYFKMERGNEGPLPSQKVGSFMITQKIESIFNQECLKTLKISSQIAS
jgi:hypothetical protein